MPKASPDNVNPQESFLLSTFGLEFCLFGPARQISGYVDRCYGKPQMVQ